MLGNHTFGEDGTNLGTLLFRQRVAYRIGRHVIGGNLFALTGQTVANGLDILTTQSTMYEGEECTETAGIALAFIAGVGLDVDAVDTGGTENTRNLHLTFAVGGWKLRLNVTGSSENARVNRKTIL